MLSWLTKGKEEVGEMLTLADKGGRVVSTPPFLADKICEQPLITSKLIFNMRYIPLWSLHRDVEKNVLMT